MTKRMINRVGGGMERHPDQIQSVKLSSIIHIFGLDETDIH